MDTINQLIASPLKFGIIAGILTYADHFHYLNLPPVVIGCWILSNESDISFFIYLGIVLAVYILISVLEETVFFEGFIGTVIALPLTQLIMISKDHLISYSEKQIRTQETE